METETPKPLPRFVFVHRINVSTIEQASVGAFLEKIKSLMASADKLPMLEYFVPVRDGADYLLTIVDLNTLQKVEV